jgi:AmpD protein
VQVDLATGRINGARWVPSPNCDARPTDCAIDLVVVHAISLPPGEFGGDHIDNFFQNRLDGSQHPYFATIDTLQVSAHLLIDRDGALTQYVSFNDRAWHAGQSNYCGRERCNDFSIGIELEGCDELPFTEPQYVALTETLRALLAAYASLSAARLVGHSDISPGRKTDPGPHFNWPKLRALLSDKLATQTPNS